MTTGASSSFRYRLPRFQHRLRLEVCTPAYQIQGRCLDLSETGLLVQLEHPVGPCETYTVRLILSAWTVDLQAVLAYADGCRAGFQFLFQSDQQRHFVRAILQTDAWKPVELQGCA